MGVAVTTTSLVQAAKMSMKAAATTVARMGRFLVGCAPFRISHQELQAGMVRSSSQSVKEFNLSKRGEGRLNMRNTLVNSEPKGICQSGGRPWLRLLRAQL